MIFHVPRSIDALGLEAAALKFVEDRLVGLAHHIRQNAQATPVRHADYDIGQAELTAALDDLLHRGDQRLAAIETETLGAHVFDMQVFFEAFRLDQLVQDRAASILRKLDFLAEPFDPLLQPRRFFGVRDMHVLEGEGSAVGPL